MAFHDRCNRCWQDTVSSDCCASCRDLRIRHLLICLGNLTYLRVELGSFATLQSRKQCPLCQFFCGAMIHRYLSWQEKLPSRSKRIFLEFGSNGPAVGPRHKRTVQFSFRDFRENYFKSPILSPKVKWNTLRGWNHEYMARASMAHSRDLFIRHTSAPGLSQPLLMIDVARSCIVPKPSNHTYAALSYVWGNPTQGDLQATLANIDDLKKPGAFKQGGVPLTILDAMTAASELNIRYLWVDRLCIVQDDPETKHNLINQMDSIYAGAFVTFVAGAGKDSSYGLPGVSTERSPGQAQIRIQGVELTEKLPAFVNDIVPRMAWNQRGWTYQEAMLSANLIFFTDYGVFYEWKKSTRGILAEPPNLPTTTTNVFGSINDFFKSVEAYSRRTLSYDTDIEKAFLGVLRSSYGGEHVYGSPLRLFDAIICWDTKDRRRVTRRSTDNDIFPSWSWLSVMGGVDFSGAHSARDSLPVATWAMNLRTASGNSELRFIGHKSDENFYYNPRLLDRAWEAGFFEGERPSHSKKATTWNSNFTPHWSQSEKAITLDINSKPHWSESIWQSYESFWFQSRGLQSLSTPSQLGLAEKYPLCLRPGHILVRTQSARFPKDLIFDYEKKGPSRDGKCVEGMQQSCEGSGELGHMGMIALSFIQSDEISDEDHDYDEHKLNRYHWAYWYEGSWRVNAMRIRHIDGVAYRMGLGSVTLKEWKAAKPVFETIVLG